MTFRLPAIITAKCSERAINQCMTAPPPAPAGWYPDPTSGTRRYWDGTNWATPPPQTINPDPRFLPPPAAASTRSKRSPLPLLIAIVGGFVLLAVFVGMSNTDSSTKTRPPTNAMTNPTPPTVSLAPPTPTTPVMVSGTGESIQTVNLEPGGYTVNYTNANGFMIVETVNRDGTTGAAFINAMTTSGITTYASSGPVTLKIWNTQGGPWTLNFVPLS